MNDKHFQEVLTEAVQEKAEQEAEKRLEEPICEEEQAAPEANAPSCLVELADLAARLTVLHQARWEAEAGEDLLLARELRRLHPGENTQDILAHLNQARDRQAAELMGLSFEELISLRERLSKRREQERARHHFAQTLLQQEEALRRTQPDFDLTTCIREYPAFRALILAGEPVAKALSYLDTDTARRLAEQQVAQRISRRATRPRPLSAPGPVRRQVTVDAMSEAELRRIDEKLKRGEKVRLS